jgi:hypothetical protein
MKWLFIHLCVYCSCLFFFNYLFTDLLFLMTLNIFESLIIIQYSLSLEHRERSSFFAQTSKLLSVLILLKKLFDTNREGLTRRTKELMSQYLLRLKILYNSCVLFVCLCSLENCPILWYLCLCLCLVFPPFFYIVLFICCLCCLPLCIIQHPFPFHPTPPSHFHSYILYSCVTNNLNLPFARF